MTTSKEKIRSNRKAYYERHKDRLLASAKQLSREKRSEINRKHYESTKKDLPVLTPEQIRANQIKILAKIEANRTKFKINRFVDTTYKIKEY